MTPGLEPIPFETNPIGQSYAGFPGYAYPGGLPLGSYPAFSGYGGSFGSPDAGRLERRGLWQRDGVTVDEILIRDVRSVGRQTPIREVARIMREDGVAVLPVIDENRKLIGMISDRDILVRLIAEGKPFESTKTEEVMTEDVEAVTRDEDVREALEVMGNRQLRRIPVVDREDHLLGMVNINDIAARADVDEELQNALERISARRSFWNRPWR